MFRVGDVIRGVNPIYKDEIDKVFTVIEDQKDTMNYYDHDKMTIEIGYFEETPRFCEDFELVMAVSTPDQIVVTVNSGDEPTTDLYKQVAEYVRSRMELTTNGLEIYDEDNVLRVGDPRETPNEPLGMYRPNLEDRKVDKVRVELVDHGFPNALWALAEVMTWAQTAKGYDDHDWKNLPVESLQAAASRHRQKHNMGELNDHESKLLHKAHEAFGVLAELELLLTKKDA